MGSTALEFNIKIIASSYHQQGESQLHKPNPEGRATLYKPFMSNVLGKESGPSL